MEFKDIIFRRIKEIQFNIREEIFIPSKPFQNGITLDFGHSIEKNFIEIRIKLVFHGDTPAEEFLSLTVQNIFEVPNLKEYFKDNMIMLPPDIIIYLINCCINHGRAILSFKTAGTVLNDAYMPFAPADSVAKHFFPYMFNQQTKD
jgi:hypothetical protein